MASNAPASSQQRGHVVVIGAGVIGLSSAIRLQEAGFTVTIIARDFPGPAETIDPVTQINYTSPWGGAHNRWIPPASPEEEAREHAMSVRTYHAMQELVESNPEAGITFMKGIDYLEDPSPVYLAIDEKRAKELGMEEFRLHRPEELPSGVKLGYEYRTWCVNPMVYCSFLLRRFIFRGGKTLKREIRDPLELFRMPDLGTFTCVVNASGNGFGDEMMFITRGQTCLVANECDVTITRQNANGHGSFNVPRNFEGGTIIGGTKEPDNWDPNPSIELRERLLANFAAMYPQILGTSGQFHVIRDIVGRRPTRKGGLRLETESVGLDKKIIHAYGLGGRGFELSWESPPESEK